MSNDGVDVRMSDGRLFHARGPATANARSPMVERRVGGTTRSADDTERRRRRAVLATGTASSAMLDTNKFEEENILNCRLKYLLILHIVHEVYSLFCFIILAYILFSFNCYLVCCYPITHSQHH